MTSWDHYGTDDGDDGVADGQLGCVAVCCSEYFC